MAENCLKRSSPTHFCSISPNSSHLHPLFKIFTLKLFFLSQSLLSVKNHNLPFCFLIFVGINSPWGYFIWFGCGGNAFVCGLLGFDRWKRSGARGYKQEPAKWLWGFWGRSVRPIGFVCVRRGGASVVKEAWLFLSSPEHN